INVFPAASTNTLYLRSVRCKARSSSITPRTCFWFCAAYAAFTTYRFVVMIIWTPLLFLWTKLSCYAILNKRVFIRSRKQLYEFLLVLSRGFPKRPEISTIGGCLERRFDTQYGSAETRTGGSATSARGPAHRFHS